MARGAIVGVLYAIHGQYARPREDPVTGLLDSAADFWRLLDREAFAGLPSLLGDDVA